MAEVTQSSSELRQAPYIEEAGKTILDNALLLGETPVNLTDIGAQQQIAGMDPQTLAAISASGGLGDYQDYITQGAGTVGTGIASLGSGLSGVNQMFTDAGTQAAGSGQLYSPDQATLDSYMNPYQQSVTQASLDEMNRQADIQRRGITASQAGSGAFGGDRGQLQLSEFNRNLTDVQSRKIFEDYAANFNQATNQAQSAFENQQKRQQGVGQLLAGIGQGRSQEAVRGASAYGGLGTTQANMGGAGQNMLSNQLQAQSQFGALGQQQAQRELDASRANALAQQYEPYQRVNFMSDIFKPNIGSSTSAIGTNVAPSASPLSQAIGAGIAGLGLNKALGNPMADLFPK
jgi:hypothetical protein|tara:strand:- start:13 stop:1053 length:1041 start_codon:yes stop_codon:yes gene_type:complete